MTLQPGNRLGNYEIVGKIGAGGMGAVYKGYQATLGRYVAIKVLPPQTAGDPAFAERFAQEARAIGKLRHPNIVTAFDFAHDGDLAYLVSEFIDGGTLADQLGTPLPVDYAIGILTPIAAALDYAHARGVVHRDIKPQNILLMHDGTPVLTDFGLAKIVGPGSGMTLAGSLMGTAEYMAPECASGSEAAGPAADQYALGLIAYQMLVGRHPFPADNPLSALMAHVHKPVPIPSSFGVVLPQGVEAALLRALAKRPEERFPRCGDLVRALTGSAYGGVGAMPAVAPPAALSPSDAPIVPLTATSPSAPEAILSPSALVRPLERAPSTPSVSAAATAPAPAPTIVSAAAADVGAAAVPPVARLGRKRPPWWRRRRMLVLPAILLVLLVLNLPNQEGRIAGLTATPAATETPRPTRPAGGGGTTATATATATALGTSAPTATDLPIPTVTAVPVPTTARTPTPVPVTPSPTTPAPEPTFNWGHTPQTATLITPGLYNGNLVTASEVDWFRVSLNANTTIVVDFKGKTLSGAAVAITTVNLATGAVTVLVEDTDSGGSALVSYHSASSGSYFIRVRSTRNDTGTYTLGLALR